TFAGGSLFTKSRSIHSVILVRHGDEQFLFDTGLGAQIDEQFESVPWWAKPFLAYKKLSPAVATLEQGGIPKSSITKIILSHLHWDHASGIVDFPDAEVWARPEEIKHGMEIPDGEPAFRKEQYEKANFHPVILQDRKYEIFAESLDVYGDGSVVLVPLTGHT